MAYSIIDPEHFLSDGVFRESEFLEKSQKHDWALYKNKQVLVRGCSSAIFPPWAFMYLTGKLAASAKTVRYGNEHDNVVVFRADEKNKDVNRDAKVLKK
ncbi:MAG: DUF2480 family protein [Candidatus Zixiibacteriota bacterium]